MKPTKLLRLQRPRPEPWRFIVAALLAAVSAAMTPAVAQIAEPIEFGVDGPWAYDGECDDRRFRGPGRSSVMDPAGLFQDAFDCRNAYQKRRVWLASDARDMDFSDLNFGIDAAPPDGLCSDARFEGPGMSPELNEGEEMDSFDCARAYFAATIRLPWESPLYGDDSGPHPHDGECDDPRFVRTSENDDETDRSADSIGRDASDCWKLKAAGEVVRDEALGTSSPQIHFGDNSGSYAYDGECDDPRFEGVGMAESPSGDDAHRDAYDCANAIEMGTVKEVAVTDPADVSGIHEFGDNSSSFAFDNECDDPRFEGSGMAAFPDWSNVGRDAFDCARAHKEGNVSKYENWLPLHEAIFFKKYDEVAEELGEDANLANGTLETESGNKIFPLGLAALTPTIEEREVIDLLKIIDLLIEAGADTKATSDLGLTAFVMATLKGGHIDILRALLVDGAEEIRMEDDLTPLHIMAAFVESPDKLEIFKESKLRQQLAEEDRTALHVAAEYNETPGVVSKLVQIGLNVDAQNQHGETPLYLAVRSHNAQAVDELLAAGAKLDIGSSKGKTPRGLADELRNPIIYEMFSDASDPL